MLADGDGLLDEVVQVLGDVGGQPLGLQDTQDLVTGDKADLSHTVRVTQDHAWRENMGEVRFTYTSTEAKFKCPRVLGDQKIIEDNQELRPGCSPDYHIFFVKELTQKFSSQLIFQVIFLFTNKNSSMRTYTM